MTTTLSDHIRKKRGVINQITAFALLLSAVVCMITGFVKWPGLLPVLGLSPGSVHMDQFTLVHDWSGLIMAVCTLVHILLHKRWVLMMIRKSAPHWRISMNNKQIMLILSVGFLFSLVIGVVCSVQTLDNINDTADTFQINADARNLKTQAESIKLTNESYSGDQIQADSLSGTCPKGLHCSCSGCVGCFGCAGCHMWSDLDQDNACDRGE